LIVGEGKFGIGTSIRMIFDGKPGFVIGEWKLKESDGRNQFE
jgi:hypothetical protein